MTEDRGIGFRDAGRSALTYSKVFFSLLIFLIVLALVAQFFVIRTIIIPNHLELAEKRCVSIARSLQYSCPYMTLPEIQALLERIRGKEPEISYLLMVNKHGRALAHSSAERVGMIFNDPISMASCRDGKETRQIYIRDQNNPSSLYHGERVIDINFPMYNKNQEHVGAFTIGLSLKKIREVEEQYNFILASGSLLLLLMLAVIVRSYYAMVKPMWLSMTDNISRYECLMETSPDCIVTLGKDGVINYINRCGVEMLGGNSAAHFTGREYRVLVAAEMLSDTEAIFQSCLDGGEVRDLQLQLVKFVGGSLDVDVNASPFFLAGELQGLICIIRDVSARKRMDAIIKENELKYRTLFENSHDAIVIMDRAIVVECNDETMKMFRRSREDIIGRGLFSFSPLKQSDGQSSEAKIDALMEESAEDGLRMFEWTFQGGDQEEFFADIYVKHITVNQNSLLFCVVRDITERRRQEELIRRQLHDLEARNREMERFNYTISHDLRSPIITIKGFVGALAEDAGNGNLSRMTEDIARIDAAADKMQALLESLRDLSCIGRVVNPFTVFSMNVPVAEAVELLHGALTEKHIEVIIEKGMPEVCADAIRMREVFQNLIENSIKFMGDTPTPRIEIGTMPQNGETLFYVRDNGVGIERAYHDKVFGLFDKLDKKTAGTGIGLALVKRIIEVHGGTIRVESEGAGKGTAMVFSLPRHEKTGERQ